MAIRLGSSVQWSCLLANAWNGSSQTRLYRVAVDRICSDLHDGRSPRSTMHAAEPLMTLATASAAARRTCDGSH